jgi:general secretion pathway protein D
MPPPPLPGGGRAFGPVSRGPVNSVRAAPATPDTSGGGLDFPDAPVKDVLDHYALLTGKNILTDQTVQGTVNIVIHTPVTKEEAITIIEVALTLNGYSLVPVGDNIVKVLGLNKNVRQSGLPIYFDLAELPSTEESVSFLVRLRYIDAQEVAALLQQYIPPGQSTMLPRCKNPRLS